MRLRHSGIAYPSAVASRSMSFGLGLVASCRLVSTEFDRVLSHDVFDCRAHLQVRAPHHGLSRLRSGSGTAADLRSRLAGAFALLAAPVASVRSTGLSLYRARHARLRQIEHLRSPRG